MMALLRATCPVERSVHERLSPPTPKWPFNVLPSTSKKTNVHADFVRRGTPNWVDTGPSIFHTNSSIESGCSFYKGPSSDGGNILEPDPLLPVHNQTAGGFFTYEFDATRKPDIYEDNNNEPGQPFHMDTNVTTGVAGSTLDINLVQAQEVENPDSYPANVPAEFLILHESDHVDKSPSSLDSDNHGAYHDTLHGEEQERGISGRAEKEIELRKLDQIAEDLAKFHWGTGIRMEGTQSQLSISQRGPSKRERHGMYAETVGWNKAILPRNMRKLLTNHKLNFFLKWYLLKVWACSELHYSHWYSFDITS